MANAYAILIEAKRRNIDTIFPQFRDEVTEILRQKGLDGYGEKIVVEA